ncbi:EAL domain-containing protein [Paraburkholderia sp. A1RI_3L]|uniref:EAL domain-containing protein n=1 Tax=Paraburkholderia TaxID=1822464 RepID=UPI003B7F135A
MNDMDVAAEVFGAMRDARVLLRREPVRSIVGGDAVLYCECLSTVINSHGRQLRPVQFIPSLERLQLIGAFDRHVFRQAITLLRSMPEVRLGINVSAQSAVADIAWEAMLHLVERAPDVATRLVVEITETAPLDAGQGRRFAQRLRQAGCRVAIDDFGVGYGVETAIRIQTPDIIKIDGSFVAAARRGETYLARLARLVRLASELAGEVVVEGVEQQDDLTHARECGAKWAQGRLLDESQASVKQGHVDRTATAGQAGGEI